MSATSCVHIVDVNGGYRPSVQDLCDIFNYFHITKLKYILKFRNALDWNDEDNEDNPIEEHHDVNIHGALEIYRKYLSVDSKLMPIMFSAEFNRWASAFADHFNYITPDISGHFMPADFVIVIGKKHIPSIDFEIDQMTSEFQVELYGNQMPPDIPRYLEEIRKDNKIVEIVRFLSSLSNDSEFRVIMSAYY